MRVTRRDDRGRWAVGNREWTREQAIEAVQDFHRRHGFQPVQSDPSVQEGIPHPWTAGKLFGSWNEMIRAAGFEPYPARSSHLAKAMARRDRAAATDNAPW